MPSCLNKVLNWQLSPLLGPLSIRRADLNDLGFRKSASCWSSSELFSVQADPHGPQSSWTDQG